jgi:lipopolysaccharide transport system ATP-binding protein
MSDIAIRAENLSKVYRKGERNSGTLSNDLRNFYNSRIKNQIINASERPDDLDRPDVLDQSLFWSLKDISFEIKKGERVAIKGENGAGKSTLLKILSKVTTPTSGRITGQGRIVSLLEVGTGFHPELTGKENIFLNGAILGMRRREIQSKLEAILDFAVIGDFLETPVKRYSSGMYVRLAFAVAAHLESDILIIDEVLAVGDADFQRKCLEKMISISKEEGKTILFVSHNKTTTDYLCDKEIILDHGRIVQPLRAR